MQDDTIESIAGALTAQHFLLQNLYATLLSNDENPIETCQTTAREMLRQYTSIPSTNVEPTGAEGERIIQHGARHLERFWETVEGRLRTIPR